MKPLFILITIAFLWCFLWDFHEVNVTPNYSDKYTPFFNYTMTESCPDGSIKTAVAGERVKGEWEESIISFDCEK